MRQTHEEEVQRELERMQIQNEDRPLTCPKCGGDLEESGGYVGETILYCPNKTCEQSIVWEDSEDAIRRVL